MFARLWKLAVRIAGAALVVLGLLLIIELLRAYQTLHTVHPYAAYAFGVVLAAVVVWLCVRLLGGWRVRPRPLKCPNVGDLDDADLADLRRYGRYLTRYLRRLGHNRALSPERRGEATTAAIRLRAGLRACRDRDAAETLLKEAEADAVEPLLAELDALAEREIRDCVVQVMVGVAVSPWDALDLLIVVYRTGGMIPRITQIYNSRPSIREQWTVFADTVRIVGMIKFARLTGALLRNTARLPLAGRILEPMVQAVGAGVITSAAGHAAKHRCRAFRGWSRQEEAQRLAGRIGQYLADCSRAAWENVAPILRAQVAEASAATWSRLRESLDAAVGATARTAEAYVRTAGAGAQSVSRTGRGAWRRGRRFVGRIFGRGGDRT